MTSIDRTLVSKINWQLGLDCDTVKVECQCGAFHGRPYFRVTRFGDEAD